MAGRKLGRAEEELGRRVKLELTALTPEVVPDGVNAVVAFRAAGKMLSATPEPPGWSTSPDTMFPWDLEWRWRADMRHVTCARAFEMARSAAALPQGSGRDLAKSFPSYDWTADREVYELLLALGDESLRYHLWGNDDAAIVTLRVAAAIPRAMTRDGIAIESIRAEWTELYRVEYLPLIAADLRIGTGVVDAKEASVRSLVRELSTPMDLNVRRCAGLLYLENKTIFGEDLAAAGVMGPVRKISLAQVAEELVGEVDHVGEPGRVKDRVAWQWPGLLDVRGERPALVGPLLARWETGRRASAIALAMALYRHDHGGRWPGRLEELVPDEMDAVPSDPGDAAGRPFVYAIEEGGRRPVLHRAGGPSAAWVKAPSEVPIYSPTQAVVCDLARFERADPPHRVRR